MQFDFGQNWTDFARAALTAERVESAQKEFAALLEGVPLRDATFLDIGFGDAADRVAEFGGDQLSRIGVDHVAGHKAHFWP